ncbi:glycosyltransferase family 2 protein [Danxiaibacter flavus]|uniref:Glycosyltransferase family 2 protein n=1 Tax=Danxiaibacter flavus TaxID=3049108 RepID=A0ABV3ZDC0_9BACT|nr:glycosyltransferase family 2 protein [Chitinophagaceae bacterium DXS]
MKTEPLVSVIIPTYNRADKIQNAIKSVINQTYKNVEIIVADDGSTDNTLEVLKAYPSVSVLELEHGGQGWARSNGLRHAKGVYIASLDSDDTWENSFLLKCVEQIEAFDLDFVFANWLQDLGNGQRIDFFSICYVLRGTLKQYKTEWVYLDSEELRHLYLTGCPSPSSSLLIRRSSLKNNWNSELRIADDWCLALDMIFSSPCKAAFTREILWHKNRTGNNVFDGRYAPDLVRDMLHDVDYLFSRLGKKFTSSEQKTFTKTKIRVWASYSYVQIRHNLKIFKSILFFLRAMFLAPFFTMLLSFQKMIHMGKIFVRRFSMSK